MFCFLFFNRLFIALVSSDDFIQVMYLWIIPLQKGYCIVKEYHIWTHTMSFGLSLVMLNLITLSKCLVSPLWLLFSSLQLVIFFFLPNFLHCVEHSWLLLPKPSLLRWSQIFISLTSPFPACISVVILLWRQALLYLFLVCVCVHVCIYHQCELMDSYFLVVYGSLLSLIILMHKLSQIWPMGSLSIWLLCLFWNAPPFIHPFIHLSTYLLSEYNKIVQTHLMSSSSWPWSLAFLMGALVPLRQRGGG